MLESQWYAARAAGSNASPEDQRAAVLTTRHAGTPSLTILDSLGRAVIEIIHNRVLSSSGQWQDEKYLTFTRMDIDGKPLWVRDVLNHLVVQYIAPAKASNDPNDMLPVGSIPGRDMTGQPLFQHSMDSGARWQLMDAGGRPMLAWDFNQTPQGSTVASSARLYTTDYDALRRPTALWLSLEGAARIMMERYEYQDALPDDPANLNGQLVRHYDPSGLNETIRRDFKGNILEMRRTLNNAPQEALIDWRNAPQNRLETDASGLPAAFTRNTEYDALNRITKLCNWRQPSAGRMTIYLPRYNLRGLLHGEDLVLRATSEDPDSGARASAIEEIQYNAKGQKTYMRLGNGTLTHYAYDPQTFRLTQLRTTRPNQDPAFPGTRANLADPNVLQQLNYTYDPKGNVVEIYDAAFKPAFFANVMVEPRSRYEYDALYRLTSATGRENYSFTAAPGQFDSEENIDFPVAASNALRGYTQYLRYDPVGNISQMRQTVTSSSGGWTRDYAYAFDDPAQPASNRLWQTWEGGDRTQAVTYTYDTHGNLLNLARVAPGQHLQWDPRDMIHSIDLVGGGMVYYQYDADKQRTRKQILRQATDSNGNTSWIKEWERINLDGFERYRRWDGSGRVV